MWDDRWQLISRDPDDLFGAIRGDAVWLSTVELPYFGIGPDVMTIYETALFKNDECDILKRYKTKAEAIKGHDFFAKKYRLR